MNIDSCSRRRLLGTVGGAGLLTLAGCGTDGSSSQDSTSTTVRFTDSVTRTTESVTTSTDTPESTSTAETVIFDGGDAAAFKAALDTLAENPGSTLEIDPGRYRLDRPTYDSDVPLSAHFVPIGLQNVTIEGNGATLVGTQPHLGMLHFLHGSNITIRNLTIDYDPVPFTQGEIVEVVEDENAVVLELDDGYPSLSNELFEIALSKSGNVHTREGELIGGIRARGASFKKFRSFSRQGDRQWKVSFVDQQGQMDGIERGRKLTIDTRGGEQKGPSHAVVGSAIDDLRIENVTVRTCSNMAFVIKQCENPVLRNVTVATPEGSDRLSTTTGDGVHIVNSTGGPVVENSEFDMVGDDCIVVNTLMVKVMEFLDDQTVRVGDSSGVYITPKDRLEGMTASGIRTGELPPIAEIDYREEYPESWAPGRPETITFEEPIRGALEQGAYLSNTSKANSGFAIRNNTIRESVANGIRVAAGPGVVEDNEIDGVAKHGVWLRCDTEGTFDPKRWSNDVTVRNNRITRPGMSFFAGPQPEAIQAVYWPADGFSAQGQPHRNLHFEGNEIVDAAHRGISVSDTREAKIRSNEMRQLNQLSYPDATHGVHLDNTDTVSVVENTVVGSSEHLSRFGTQSDSTAVSTRNNELRIDGESVPASIVSWVPIRLLFDNVKHFSHRSLAIRILDLSLFDESGSEVFSSNVGSGDEDILFEEGVYDPEAANGESWRWFGGEDAEAVLSFPSEILEKATTIELRAVAVENQITTTVAVNGSETDEATFGESDPEVHRFSLVSD